MRKFSSLAIGAAALVSAAPALGQEQLGKQMDVVFSGDRLFGISFSRRVDEDRCGPAIRRTDCENDWTTFGIGWRGRSSDGAGRGHGATPFDVPRFAFDIFVIDSLSVGGSIGYVQYSDEDQDGDDWDYSDFIFSPRVGYLIMFSDKFGFWPRGGFTYHSGKVDPPGRPRASESGFAFTAEAMFVFTPVEHFGFAFGPTLDIDFAGDVESRGGAPAGDDDWDRRYRSIGLLNVSVFGWI
jgi:hypothetical protein